MAYIKEYWNDKEKRAEQAKKHTKEMEKAYSERIKESIENSVIYDVDFQSSKTHSCKTDVIVEAVDSVSAVMSYAKECKNRMAVLNFSSYKNPGGMFINGSKAQEECLCHESSLYNVLSEFVLPFYEWNNKHKNKALYLNRGLYSPDIVFSKGGNYVLCDVITCAAPNKSAAQKYQNVSDEENAKVLRSRIKFVLDIAKENQVELLILGAYGCGVFGQDATEVAGIFKEHLSTTHKCFNKVIFAIPKGRDKNLEAFETVFNH
ncbi:MAG: TIGR02452 family protein [Lachnospiraceae bacterium]|nr:TIGR02452 family protein [Lachnospiraceae bacterium]MDE6253626.1 TIGR02452 family protein [Lachnospiraceae bacterium]